MAFQPFSALFPPFSGLRFAKILFVEDVALLLAQFVGRAALRRLQPAQPATHRWVRQVLPRMLDNSAVYAPGPVKGLIEAEHVLDRIKRGWKYKVLNGFKLFFLYFSMGFPFIC